MKTPAYLIVVLFLWGNIAWAAEDPAVLRVRKEYDSIRKALPSMTVESMEPVEPSTEGGEVKAYRDGNGDVRFIRSERFFESGKEIEEYYYAAGKLIFALVEEHRYNAPTSMTPKAAKGTGGKAFDPKKTVVTANRYYFSDGRLVRWLNGKKSVPAGQKEFKESEKNVLDAAAKARAQYEGEDGH